MKPWECTNSVTNLSLIAILMLELTFTETSSYLVVLPFMKVSQIDLKKKLPLSAQKPEMSNLLPQLTDTTPYGQVVLFNAPSQPSPPNGSPRKNTKKTVPKSSTENAYE
jgi:hypothetical protein